MKRCPRCKVTQPVENFSKNKNSLDGLAYACKDCSLQGTYVSRNKNREYWSQRNPYENNPYYTKGLKKCAKCKRIKRLIGFNRNATQKDGLTSFCKLCARKISQLHKYGVYVDKNSMCEVCGSTSALSIDHDHTTGKFRGILCQLCNAFIGMAEDNVDILKSAAIYLNRHKRREK